MTERKKKRNIVSTIFAWITGSLVVLLIALQIYGQVTKRDNYDVARYGKLQILVVLTNSMEPSYKVGTALFVEHVTDFSTLKASTSLTSHDGDVITFYDVVDRIIITHRIVGITKDDNGKYVFNALGDNLYADTCKLQSDGTRYCDPETKQNVVKEEHVLGKVIGQSPAFGAVYSVMSEGYAILLFAIIPLFFVFFSSIVDLFKQLKPEREARRAQETEQDALNYEIEQIKEQEKLKLYIEMEKEKMRKELEESKGDDDE